MNRIPKFLKNKYMLTAVIFVVYIFFLDDYDLFTLWRYNSKSRELDQQISKREHQIDSLDITLNKLNNKDGIERYAREKKYYKKDDEDIYVIFKQ